jgi:hypothetical protein
MKCQHRLVVSSVAIFGFVVVGQIVSPATAAEQTKGKMKSASSLAELLGVVPHVAAAKTGLPNDPVGRSSGKQPSTPGQTNDPLGQAMDPSGQTNDPPGQANDPPGQANDPPGQANVPPGQVMDPPGQTNKPGPPFEPPGPPFEPPGPPANTPPVHVSKFMP